MSTMDVRVASLRSLTHTEGPGARFAIWVQGCTLKCSGCFNPHFWGSQGGTVIKTGSLLEEILKAKEKNPEIEGVTFLGGEPFEQAESLAILSQAIQSENLTTMVFSGYTLEELSDTTASEHGVRKEFLASIDLLVDGRYEKDNVDFERPWVGSKNQKFHFLTDKYQRETIFEDRRDSLEIRILSSGELHINGWASSEQLENLLENL